MGMVNLIRVVLRRTLVLLLLARTVLLVEMSVIFSAAQLNPAVGENVVFTCKVSNVRISKYSIYWYKIGEDNQPKKLDSRNEDGKKYRKTEVDAKTFNMKILDLKKNDSGVYYCGLISFSSNQTLIESKKLNLTVSGTFPGCVPTDRSTNCFAFEMELTFQNQVATLPFCLKSSEKTHDPRPLEEVQPEKEPGEEEGQDEEAHHKILLPVIVGSGLLLVLACSCVLLAYLIRRKREHGKSQSENAPLEEEAPSSMAVFTVDYGVLEFHTRENLKKSPPPLLPKWSPLDQTEYATIVFSQGNPDPDDRGKRTERPRNCPGKVRPHGRGQGQEAKR